jgi:ABC-type transport system substrate-binding protein
VNATTKNIYAGQVLTLAAWRRLRPQLRDQAHPYDPAKAGLNEAALRPASTSHLCGTGTMVNEKAPLEVIASMRSTVASAQGGDDGDGARARMLNDRAAWAQRHAAGNLTTLLDADGSLWRIWHPNGFNGKYWIGSQPGQRFHDLMEEARYTLDPKKRKALYAEAIEIRNEEKPSLDLFQEMVVYGTSKRVSFKPRADYRLIVAEMALAGR